MSRIRSIATGVAGILAMVSLVGCGNDAPPAPLSQFQPEIVNLADSFSFQATAVSNVTTSVSYVWSNSGAQATVNHSSAITAGSALVSIYDSNDSLVYTNGLVASLNEASAVGAIGNWRVTVTLTNLSGTLNFRAQKL